jgi:hypothetical protein
MSNPDLSYFIVMEPGSGTYFGAGSAVLIDTRRLSDAEQELLVEGSDSERGDLAEEHGVELEELIMPHAYHATVNS